MNTAKIGLGCVTFGREIDRDASFALLDGAADRGVTMFDTAAAYGGGASETILGEWLRARGLSDLCVATKILPPFDARSIAEKVEQSREGLGVASIDLLYLHSWESSAASPDCLAALDKLVQDEVVKKLGISNVDRETFSKVLSCQDKNGFARFSALQNNFNYAVRDLDTDDFLFCQSEGIDVITYSPLGAGFLTGKHKRGVESGSRFEVIPGHQDVYFHEQAWKRLAHLEEVASRFGCDQARLALAWVLHQPGIDCVLVGGRTVAHLEQAFDALEWENAGAFSELDRFP